MQDLVAIVWRARGKGAQKTKEVKTTAVKVCKVYHGNCDVVD